MLWEAVVAAGVGGLVLWLVLQPLGRPVPAPVGADEPPDPEETPKGLALAALKEIEFDRATGKLSEADYADLRERYTDAAVAALRAEDAAGLDQDEVEAMIAGRARAVRGGAAGACGVCGPRPEADAVYCSSCGGRL